MTFRPRLLLVIALASFGSLVVSLSAARAGEATNARPKISTTTGGSNPSNVSQTSPWLSTAPSGIDVEVTVQGTVVRRNLDSGEVTTTKQNVSGKLKCFPTYVGTAAYQTNAFTANDKSSVVRFEPLKSPLGVIIANGSGTVDRLEDNGSSSLHYVVHYTQVSGGGMFTTTGVGDALWPDFQLGGPVQGTLTAKDKDGDQVTPFSDSMDLTRGVFPFGQESHQESVLNGAPGWAGTTGPVPPPTAKITLQMIKEAIKHRQMITIPESFSWADEYEKVDGSSTVTLQFGKTCTGEISGAQWCARFPDIKNTGSLREPFKTNVDHFIAALEAAGATVHVNSAYRPIARVYLMHTAYLIAEGLKDPRDVDDYTGEVYDSVTAKLVKRNYPPTMLDTYVPVDICWAHGGNGAGYDAAASIQAAKDMMRGYDIAYAPAWEVSHHTERLAVDLSIAWNGMLHIKDAKGVTVDIGAPQDGAENTQLWAVGRTYGVIKLPRDRPHWSVDGN